MITVNNAVKFNDRKHPNDMELKGLSTDVKPTVVDGNPVAVNSIFLELDTKDFYYFDGEEWQKVEIEDSSGEYDREIAEINRKLKKRVFYFDTVAQMKLATDLEDGEYAITKGYYAINDGGGCSYTISQTRPSSLPNASNSEKVDNFYITLDNGLYAIPVNDVENDYYDEITCVKERHNDTDCYITTIPLNDDSNNQIDLYIKNNSNMEISDYARLHNTTISINATLAVKNPNTNNYENASVISDGQIIRNHMNPPSFLNDNYKIIGIKDNREFLDFQANNTTIEDVLAQGVKQAWLCFGKLVDNGNITNYAQDINDEIMSNYHPRQTIGIKSDKTVIIITCDGRTVQDRGLKGNEIAQLLIDKGCINAWNLDGGGSTNTMYKGTRVNKYIEDNGMQERHIVYCLNAKKPSKNKNVDSVNSAIGKAKDDIIKQLLPNIPRMLVKNPANLNELIKDTNMYSCYNATNYPTNSNNYGYLINIPIASEDNTLYGSYAKQYWLSRTDNRLWMRTYQNGNFTDWFQYCQLYGAEFTAVNNSLGIGANYPVMELNAITDPILPNSLYIDDNKIKSSKTCQVQINAWFRIECELDGTAVIRYRRNGTNIGSVRLPMKAGNTYIIPLTKQLHLGVNDYIDFTTNGGTNTGGVNKISQSQIIINQNFTY